jgi:hypothetical protein
MMIVMRCLLLLLAPLLGAAELPAVRAVYMLPMTRGLDQYLANRITNERVFQVVTDPKRADAFFTDRIGEGFEEKLAELLPEPETAEAQKEEEKKDEKDETVRGDSGPLDTVNKLAKPGIMSSFGAGKGTVFLVDAKTREVLWSAYEPSRDSTSRQMDRTALLIVDRLKRDLKKK